MAGRAAKRGSALRTPAPKSANKATNTTQPAPHFRALVSRHGPDAIAELARLSTSATPDSTRLSAIGMLLDRAYGKPKQTLEHSGEDGGPIQVTIVGDDSRLL
jgi:hypothetical protein